MTKPRAPATRTRFNFTDSHGRKILLLQCTNNERAREVNDLALNPCYLESPEVTLIHRMDQPGFDKPHVSEGDLVVADRRVKPHDGSLVIVIINGERVVRLFFTSGGHKFLCATGDSREALEITADAQVKILATVVSVIPVIS